MISVITINTKGEILENIVEIHKRCILETNSKYYSKQEIQEWISAVTIDNIKNQLNNSSWIILTDQNRIVGFAQYCKEDKELFQLQIDPDLQGKGYGKQLYEYIETDFRRNNIQQISLYSTLNAIEFYKNLGFEITKEIKYPLVKTKMDMVEMKKTLTHPHS